MFRVFACLTDSHDPRLVVLAGIMCLFASFVAVSLYHRATATRGGVRAAWIATASIATGCGIWATHFIAILAYAPGVVVGYGVGLTVLSLFAAIAMTALGLGLAVTVSALPRAAAAVGGGIVGAGVACMHYLGMAALELPGHLHWHTGLVASSILFGIVLGSAALMVAARSDRLQVSLTAAVLLTLAIVSHHFTAMGAVDIVSDPARAIDALTLSPQHLAYAIAGATAALLGMCIVAVLSDRRSKDVLREQNVVLENARNELEKTRNFLNTVIENVPAPILVRNARDGRYVLVNRAAEQLHGVSHDTMIGKAPRDLYPEHAASTIEANDRRAIESGGLIEVDEHPLPTVGNGTKIVTSTTLSIVDGNREPQYVVTMVRDRTEKKRIEAQLAHLAHHDALTSLPNRTAFIECFNHTIESAAKHNRQFAVLCIDLDRFKEVNDVFGHPVGDQLLRQVAERLSAAVEGAFLSRYGGDEFVAIIDDSELLAALAADKLQAAVADEFVIDGQSLRIGLSGGIALYPIDGADATTVIGNADAALYRAKTEGRGTVRFFEADMDKRVRDRRALVHDLRSAIEREELTICYQPQAQIDGVITGFEALARWRHPTRGMISPATFIPIAEESGLILNIGEWVLRESCREAAAWPQPLGIAINLSPVQFRHGDLPGLVHTVLLETGLAPGRLELEITEGVLINDFSRALSILRRLKHLGVKIAMDDFGTGYSSLSNLQAFPFDKIKIDQSFVRTLQSSPQSATIVRAIIGLGRGLDLPIVAEGVETAEQLAFLRKEACDEVQGFLIGKPLPISDYSEKVGRNAEAARAVA
jgi:diguanylate cyclase (GGDEF)-like protein/PAS domain S-box-containing protein